MTGHARSRAMSRFPRAKLRTAKRADAWIRERFKDALARKARRRHRSTFVFTVVSGGAVLLVRKVAPDHYSILTIYPLKEAG